jgi:hypothetical protein
MFILALSSTMARSAEFGHNLSEASGQDSHNCEKYLYLLSNPTTFTNFEEYIESQGPKFQREFYERARNLTLGNVDFYAWFCGEYFIPMGLYNVEGGEVHYPPIDPSVLWAVLRHQTIPGLRVNRRVPPLRAAAVIVSRALGLVPAGSAYPRDRFIWEASLLGQAVQLFPNVYRIDRRPPEEIIRSKGFFPSTEAVQHTLWEHVSVTSESGSFVSTTLKALNPHVVFMVAKAPRYSPANLRSHGLITMYEYRFKNIEGVRTPLEFGQPAEWEVVVSHVPLSNISHWRKIVVDRDRNGGTVSEISKWRELPIH